MTADDVCNLLTNNLIENEKLRHQMLKAKEAHFLQRFTCKHIIVIKQQFNMDVKQRNLKLLDKLLSNLRYFKRLNFA